MTKLDLAFLIHYFIVDLICSLEFGEYLVRVSQDASLFSSYFWWRDYYASPGCTHPVACHTASYTQAYCSLCEALHSTQGRAGSIQDIYKWWVTDAHCKVATERLIWANSLGD